MDEDSNSQTESVGSHELPVELPSFSGPLDLLLHLIHKDELSIYDIPIARICDQYQSYLAAMQELDLLVAGEFLRMAAWLVHLKSKMLLPRATEEGEDPRAELVERLLEYRRVKELASMLHESDVVRRGVWQAEALALSEELEQHFDLEDLDLRNLAYTYLEVMERYAAAHPPPLRVIPLRYSVDQKIRELYRAVVEEKMFPLLRHLNTRPDSEETVVLLVAALELVRLGGVRASQRRPFAEIYLRPAPTGIDIDALFKKEQASGT